MSSRLRVLLLCVIRKVVIYLHYRRMPKLDISFQEGNSVMFENFQTDALDRMLCDCDWIVNFTPIISALSYNHLFIQCKKLISAHIRKDGCLQSIIHCGTLMASLTIFLLALANLLFSHFCCWKLYMQVNRTSI